MIRSRRWLWLWAVPGLFLLIFFFLPLGAVFRTAGTAALLEGLRPSFGKQLVRALGFTFGQAALSTIFTLILGLPAAYLFARFRFPGKRLMQVLTTLPFILPTVVVAAGFNALLGPSGWLNWGLMRIFGLESAPIQVMNTLGAILLAHVFYNTGVIIRVVGSAWAQLDPRLELAGRVLGASTWQTLKQITLPLLKPSILAGTLLVFIFDFTSFGVILLLGGPAFATLEVEIYIQAMQMLNMPAAGVLSAVQLACTLGLTIVYSRLAGRRNIPLNPRLNVQGLYRLDTPKRKALAGIVLTSLAALLVLPQLALILRSLTVVDLNSGQMHMTLDYYIELFINRRQSLFYVPPIQAAVNSFFFAGVTVIISLLLGLMAAYALRVKSRLNRLLDPLLMLPLGTSAVTLGLGFILVFNQPPLDARTFPLLIPLAHSLVALPFVIR
ncbi:MAG: iron ABC transporter permease, partial [Anaerolineaceae bacterium]|nr:iron ABC transporter permease [Anaerolineaceae bacterium]